MEFFAVPAVSNQAGLLHDGTTTLAEKPYETVRLRPRHLPPPRLRTRALSATTASDHLAL